jgi:uncharacterized protein YndB with AHSA1/START domain/DNA-binding transcriptional ArsR family regulator
MDDLFKAIGDPTRRRILDLLRARDGRTVTEIETEIDMTRFGVMKHLAVLEGVGLIVPRRQGRFKYLHLNMVPLQQALDRWIDPMLRPWARRLEDLKETLETGRQTMTAATAITTTFVLQTWISTTPERLWQALTDPKDTANYYFGSAVTSDWKPGSPLDYIRPDGSKMVGGRVESIDPPRKLVTRFQPYWDGTPGRITRVTYELAPAGGSVRLTLTHEDLTEVDAGIREGWEKIFAQLKTWLETGKPLDIPRG